MSGANIHEFVGEYCRLDEYLNELDEKLINY